MEDDKTENLFAGLPAPSSVCQSDQTPKPNPKPNGKPPAIPKPVEVLRGALKRDKRPATQEENNTEAGGKDASKRVRFKTTVDASTKQVVDAMQKIAAHIGNPAKFGKASKLALQLVHAGSVNTDTCDHFFDILQVAMSSPSSSHDPALRADYHLLFTAVQDILDCFNKQQQKQLETWIIRAQVANDLCTDDSFVFSKASGRVRQAISSLPEASHEDDVVEETLVSCRQGQDGNIERPETVGDEKAQGSENHSESQDPPNIDEVETDPFGLDVLFTKSSKKDEKARKRRDEAASSKKVQDDAGRFLREHKEALIECLNIAAGRYKILWAQTMIDILVKHAYDNISKFTAQQRDAIEKLWASIREQQQRRKQGRSAAGKLDVTAFERLQEQYANEKISIRRAVGGSGERRTQQWLG